MHLWLLLTNKCKIHFYQKKQLLDLNCKWLWLCQWLCQRVINNLSCVRPHLSLVSTVQSLFCFALSESHNFMNCAMILWMFWNNWQSFQRYIYFKGASTDTLEESVNSIYLLLVTYCKQHTNIRHRHLNKSNKCPFHYVTKSIQIGLEVMDMQISLYLLHSVSKSQQEGFIQKIAFRGNCHANNAFLHDASK